jgi:subtilisin family serine protease
LIRSTRAAVEAAAVGRFQPLTLLFLLLSALPCEAAPVPDLERARGSPTRIVWVYFTGKDRDPAVHPSAASRARRARSTGGVFVPDDSDIPPAQRYIRGVEAAGARIRHVSRWLNAVSVEVDAAGASRIAELPYVARVTEVSRTHLEYAPPGDYGSSWTQMDGIQAIAAHDSGYSAAGIVVAVFDTGFRKDHLSLAPLKRIAEWDFVHSDGETANEAVDDPDQWNHGTGVWSILGAYSPGNLAGPAFNASFVLAKTKDNSGADEDHWVAAAQWADSIGVDIVSTSIVEFADYGQLNGRTTPMALATNILSRHGTLVVAAMGNAGPGSGTLWTPADCDSILSVGSVDELDVISDFSGRGPTFDGRGKPDLVAQGMNTIWADARSIDGYGSYPGTSLAAPLVSGAAALVQEAHPEWSAQQVRYALKKTADRSSIPDSTTYGWGRPRVVTAIYQSPLGPPVFPKPFRLAAPAYGTLVPGSPVTFRWRRSFDLTPGDAVGYTLQIRKVSPSVTVFSGSTADTFLTYGGTLDPATIYEWEVTATDLLGHTRLCAEPYRFRTSGGPAPLSISAPSDIAAIEGMPVSFTVTATDGDPSHVLTISVSGAPAGFSLAHISTPSPATASLSGTPTDAEAGMSPITLTWSVFDGAGGIAGATTTLHVSHATAVPVEDPFSGPPQVLSFGSRPNPFQASTQIELRLQGSQGAHPITLRIYDVRGRLVRTLLLRTPWVTTTVRWDAMTDSGSRAGAGVYYYRLEAGKTRLTRRLVLLK